MANYFPKLALRQLLLTKVQMEELDLTKIKATELLKSHDADIISAMKAFVKSAA